MDPDKNSSWIETQNSKSSLNKKYMTSLRSLRQKSSHSNACPETFSFDKTYDYPLGISHVNDIL